jgi:uncharacterized protein
MRTWCDAQSPSTRLRAGVRGLARRCGVPVPVRRMTDSGARGERLRTWALALTVGLLLSPQLAESLPQDKPSIPPAHPSRAETRPLPIPPAHPDRAETRSFPLPNPLGYVSDHARVLDAEWKARIRSVCQDLERKTGVEMVVVTVPSAKPYARANDYGSALYQRWGIGTAQQDHGVLVLVVAEGRQATVTVGKSLLGVITPPIIEGIGNTYLEPAFRASRYGEGLYRATVALAAVVQDIRVGEPPRSRLKGLGIFLTLLTSFGALWFLWWIARPDLRHPYSRLRRGEFWGSGQGGFGGNFGGFGGGMSGEGLR